jgi:hypothetical protein
MRIVMEWDAATMEGHQCGRQCSPIIGEYRTAARFAGKECLKTISHLPDAWHAPRQHELSLSRRYSARLEERGEEPGLSPD